MAGGMRAKFGVRNVRAFMRAMEAGGKQAEKAASTAIRVEGYRLMRALGREIREGAPGGHRFAPLSVIAAYGRRPYGRTAYRRLGSVVRYQVDHGPGGMSRFVFGFIAARSSASWVKIAERAQEGADFPITTARRRSLRRMAASLPAGAQAAGEGRYFFLRRGTTMAHTPPRPIIAPFWRKRQAEAAVNIKRNFARKMAGERI